MAASPEQAYARLPAAMGVEKKLCLAPRVRIRCGVTLLGWIAAVVLFLQLPIPLYWFVMHPQVSYWRQHQKAGYVTGLLLSWLPVTVLLVIFHRELFRAGRPALWEIIAGFALIVFELWIFWRVQRDLGGKRLVGQTELSGGGEIVHRGIYARIRHPRYVGSLLAILGACILAGTPAMWVVATVWILLTRIAISLEERELRDRFGAAYKGYCRSVPRFVPSFARPGGDVEQPGILK
ncbi:MAG TPA: isoprenylcysteine carboxylmethyltransferase family protein [Candidatus Acidoferrales bacterium]|nr:isoprenylcysteine carboxylmethyltransferase family protein [Candidatus Acidoferrales bacterium]